MKCVIPDVISHFNLIHSLLAKYLMTITIKKYPISQTIQFSFKFPDKTFIFIFFFGLFFVRYAGRKTRRRGPELKTPEFYDRCYFSMFLKSICKTAQYLFLIGRVNDYFLFLERFLSFFLIYLHTLSSKHVITFNNKIGFL